MLTDDNKRMYEEMFAATAAKLDEVDRTREFLNPPDYFKAIGNRLWDGILAKACRNVSRAQTRMWKDLLPEKASVAAATVSFMAGRGLVLDQDAALALFRPGGGYGGQKKMAAFAIGLADLCGIPVADGFRAIPGMSDPRPFNLEGTIGQADVAIDILADGITDALTRARHGRVLVDPLDVVVKDDVYDMAGNSPMSMEETILHQAGVNLAPIYIGALSQAHAADTSLDPEGASEMAGYAWGVDLHDRIGRVFGCVYVLEDRDGHPVAGISPGSRETAHVVAIAWTRDCPGGVRHHYTGTFSDAVALLSAIGHECEPYIAARMLSDKRNLGGLAPVSLNKRFKGTGGILDSFLVKEGQPVPDRMEYVETFDIKEIVPASGNVEFPDRFAAAAWAKREYLSNVGRMAAVREIFFWNNNDGDGQVESVKTGDKPFLVQIVPVPRATYENLFENDVEDNLAEKPCRTFWFAVPVDPDGLEGSVADRFAGPPEKLWETMGDGPLPFPMVEAPVTVSFKA